MEDLRFEIAHLARVELCTPDPEGTLWFFTELLGMYETRREGRSVYLRCYEDPYQWSLKVTEAPVPRLGHVAFRTTSAAALERRAAAFGDSGSWVEGDFGYGDAFAYRSADGHDIRILWEAEKYVAPPELRSKILTRPSKRPLRGIPVKRLDHVNLMASAVAPVKDEFATKLGLQTRERLVDGDIEVGAWMSANLLGHEVAIMRDELGQRGRLHHVAWYYGIPQHNIDAAEMFRESDIVIEAGPDRHGLTQGSFLYVFEPGGNRIELFGDCGVLEFEPDFETKTWTMDQIDVVTAIGGARLPHETYFTYGTPSALPLEHFLSRNGQAAEVGVGEEFVPSCSEPPCQQVRSVCSSRRT